MSSKRYANTTWPTCKWPVFSWIATVCGFLLAFVLFVSPGLLNQSLWERVGVAILCIVVGLGIAQIKYVATILSVIFRRLIYFKIIISEIDELSTEIAMKSQAIAQYEETLYELVRERDGYKVFDLKDCHSYDRHAYVRLQRKRGITLTVGNRLRVLTSSGRFMGTLHVRKVETEAYLSELGTDADALWLGSIHSVGTQSSNPPPDAFAVLVDGHGERNE